MQKEEGKMQKWHSKSNPFTTGRFVDSAGNSPAGSGNLGVRVRNGKPEVPLAHTFEACATPAKSDMRSFTAECPLLLLTYQ